MWIILNEKDMSWEMKTPTFESEDDKVKNEINKQLESLLKSGAKLTDVVELLDAQDFFSCERKGRGEPVANFDVEGFVKKRISENRKVSLPTEYKKIDEVILPSSEKELQFGSGNGFKEKGIIPRSTLLMEILTDMGLEYSIIEGANDPKMMRKLSYLIFNVPSIQKLVLINDEEGNATFIIHKAEQEEWKDYAKKTKEELSLLSSGLVSTVIYPDRDKEGYQEKWKKEIKSLLINGAKEISAKEVKKVEKEKTEVKTAPEGWEVFTQLAEDLNTYKNAIKNYAYTYKSEHPEWFIYFKHPVNGTLYEYFSPKLCEIIRKDFLNVAPEGWLTLIDLSKEVGIGADIIQKFLEQYRKDNPDWFKKYRHQHTKHSIDREYFHPELVKMTKERFKDDNINKEGWMTARSLHKSKKIDISATTIRLIAEKYRTECPKWFKIFRNESGNEREYYSPEFIALLIKDYSVPEEWMIMKDMLKFLRISSYGSVYRRINEYRKTNPEWFRVYKNSKNNEHEYYSPELMKKITETYNILREIPDGWLSVQAIIKEVGFTRATLYGFCKNYKQEHPNWFKKFVSQSGAQEVYLHPNLIKKILEKYANHKSPEKV